MATITCKYRTTLISIVRYLGTIAISLSSSGEIHLQAKGVACVATMNHRGSNHSSVYGQRTKPYWLFFHPYLTWVDAIIQLILPIFLPLKRMLKHNPTHSTGEALDSAVAMRIKFSKMTEFPAKGHIAKWAALANSQIAEYTMNLPVDIDILQKWKIATGNLPKSLDLSSDRTVEIFFRFPTTLLPLSATTNGETSAGCVLVETMDPKALPDNVPIILQFHGGGFTMGVAREDALVQEVVDLATHWTKQGKSFQPFITVGVEYSQAPDGPYPRAVIESLSAVDFVLSLGDRREVHISGVSAGGNLACVAGLESHRKYPGRIKTVQAHAPMLCPSADSTSCFLNSMARLPSPEWLRWCWRSYLGMDPPSDDSTSTDSNVTLWEQCIWNQSPTKRLVDPTKDVPRSWTETSTRFFITTNKADPLHDDGVKLVEVLQEAGAAAQHFDHGGSHVFGSRLDRSGLEEKYSAWTQLVFHET